MDKVHHSFHQAQQIAKKIPQQQNIGLPQQNTMPATSATTTNHYIINNLNFIGGTPNSAKPPKATEAYLAHSRLAVPYSTSKEQKKEEVTNNGYASAGEKADGFDLIMQDGQRANDFLSSLPAQSEDE